MRGKTLDATQTRPALRRRRVLQGAAAGAVLAGSRARAQSPVALTLAVWGGQAEQDAFNALITGYQVLHPKVTIRLEVNGGAEQLYQQVDTRLAARQAPDLFRIQYQQFGGYAAAHALVDLSPYLDASFIADFAPVFWQATNYQGKPFALPHHTDTLALYYNADMMRKLEIQPPRALEKCWSWQDFINVARSVKDKGLAPFGFAMGWQGGAGYRWLPFLYQHGGQLLDADLRQPQITSKQGVETIAWTQSWFKEGLVPPGTTIKSTESTQNLFANGTIGMLFGGDWQIPFLQNTVTDFRWEVTYMPRDVGMASDLGGNCLAVSRDSKNPEVAADFLKFMGGARSMWDFVTAAQVLPVRLSLMRQNLPYSLRPESMKMFVIQAGTIPAHLVRTVTMPEFSKINASLTNQLDLAFTSGQDPATAARNIDAAMRTVLG